MSTMMEQTRQGLIDEFRDFAAEQTPIGKQRDQLPFGADGEPVVVFLAEGQSSYRYFVVGDTQYCYNPHADSKGRWWSWQAELYGGMFHSIKDTREHRQRQQAKNWARSQSRLAEKAAKCATVTND